MPWIGVETANDQKISEVSEYIEEVLNYKILDKKTIQIKTKKSWKTFTVFDVVGFVEGVAKVISIKFNLVSLESGKHLVLGEPSAKLWDEAVLIVFPNGDTEMIPIFTYDGFIDVRMPNENIKGVKATIFIAGKKYELPLSLRDLIEIYQAGKHWMDKVEKAASVYGLTKILSEEALSSLKKARKEEEKIEVDYETGFIIVSKAGKISTIPIQAYILELINEDKLDKALEIYEKAPDEIKEKIEKVVIDEYEFQASLKKPGYEKLMEYAKKAGFSDKLEKIII